MATPHKKEILFPTGRLVGGSLYEAQTKDSTTGLPLVIKRGPDAGKPTQRYWFAVAIPKAGEQHWASTTWGALIWEVGHLAFPAGQAQTPNFAWKITDGDSTILNTGKRPTRPCDREGYKGNWVVSFTSQFAPKICDSTGKALITEVDAVKLGYFIQVYGNVAGNGDLSKPGVYMNHDAVSLQGYGPEITWGPDLEAIGFGNGPAIAGMTQTPTGMTAPPAIAAPMIQPSVTPPPLGAAVVVPATPAAIKPAVAIAPHPPILMAPAAPAPPPPPPIKPARVMLPAAQGATYEALIGAGWTDALLVQHGMMQP
jgi:hypothetical protein